MFDAGSHASPQSGEAGPPTTASFMEEKKRYQDMLDARCFAIRATVDPHDLLDRVGDAACDLGNAAARWEATPELVANLKASIRVNAQQAAKTGGMIGVATMAKINEHIEAGWNEGVKRSGTGAEAFRPLDLAPLRTKLHSAPAFPIEVLGERWAGWVSRTAASAVSPPGYVGSSLLALGAALIGNARRVQVWQGWVEPTILWVAIIGKPSTKKSPAINAVLGLADRIDRRLIDAACRHAEEHELKVAAAMAAKMDWEKKCKAARSKGEEAPSCPREALTPQPPIARGFVVRNATIEKLMAMASVSEKGLLMGLDELTALLANFSRYSSGTDRPAWLEAYGGGSYRVDRQKMATPLFVNHWAVGIVGGIQPDPFRRFLAKNGEEDGLAARFLVTWPDEVERRRPSPRKPWESDDWTNKAAERLFGLQLVLVEGAEAGLEPNVVPMSMAAADRFERWWSSEHGEQAKQAEGFYAGALGKMDGQCARIAITLEFLKWAASEPLGAEPSEVSLEAVEGAITIIENYFKPMARRAYGRAGQPLDLSAAAALAKWIADNRVEQFNATKARDGEGWPGALRDRKDVAMACDVLVEAGWLRSAGKREGKTSGRKSSDYEINPLLWGELEKGAGVAP